MARYVLGENAARQFKALVRGKGEVGNRPAQGAAVAFDAEYANPFTVKWAASVDGGSWIIWLPSSDLVISDAGSIDPTKDLVEAGGDYPKGWYKLDGSALSKDTGGELWLNISWGDTTSARFTGSKEEDGAEKSLAVPICKASVNQETGARWVRQLVTSAIVTGVSVDDFIPPFTVRWSASVADAAGAWVIWLPGPAQLVMFNGTYLDIGGITAAQALPAGWYTIDGVGASRDKVWLVINVTKSDSGEIVSVGAELSATERQAATGETVYNIVVAEMITDEATGAKRVKQFVDSAVILGGTSSSGEQTVGVSGQYEIYRNMYYDMYTHKLMGERWFLTFDNGLLIGAKSGAPEEIFEAVPHQAHVGE